MSHVILEGEYLAAAIALRDIAAAKKELAEREQEAKAIIAKHLAVGERGVTPDGEEIVAVRAGASRFDPELAAANLPPDILGQISVFTADSKRAKAILAPGLYTLCCGANKPSVVTL